jgi:hypothetical protein
LDALQPPSAEQVTKRAYCGAHHLDANTSCHQHRYQLVEITSSLPRWCANAASSIVGLDLNLRYDVDISYHYSILRCASSAAQHPLSRLCSDDIAGDVLLILTRLDYCNSVLFGLTYSLQSVQNAAARVVFNLRRTAHVTDALMCLHWLQPAGA